MSFTADNDDKVTGLISIDFEKAFGVVNNNILLHKVKIYGVSDPALQWFHSYLSDRKQCVRVNACTSSLLPINQVKVSLNDPSSDLLWQAVCSKI